VSTVDVVQSLPAPLAGWGPELAQRVVEEVTALVGAPLRPEVEAQLADLTLHGYDVFLCMLGGDDQAGGPERLAALVGHLFDDMDISLEDALLLSRHLQQLLQDQVREAAARHLEAAELTRAVAIGQRLANDLSVALADGWLAAQRRHVEDRAALEAALLRDLLAAPPRVGDARRLARRLRIDLTGPWEVGLLCPVALPDTGVLTSLRQAFWGGVTLVAQVEDGLAVAVHRDSVTASWPEPPAGTWCGIGAVHADARGLRLSYEEAREALGLARLRGVARLRFEDSWLDRFLMGAVTVQELAAVVLAPVEDLTVQQRAAVLETLEAYLDCRGSVAEMAAALQMHRQSVNYRLSNLRRLFGAGLSTPEGRLALHVVVKAAHLDRSV
jgi:hypothetical protein